MSNFDILDYKIIDKETLAKRLAFWCATKEKIVFTNGCFDLLHQGHLSLLIEAASFGSQLIVGLNSDSSIRKIKGEHRPIQDQQTRARVLAALPFVSAVVLFDEETPGTLIKAVAPAVLVKGGDYKKEEIVGADIVEKNGGSVKIIDLLAGFSTSTLVEKIRKEA